MGVGLGGTLTTPWFPRPRPRYGWRETKYKKLKACRLPYYVPGMIVKALDGWEKRRSCYNDVSSLADAVDVGIFRAEVYALVGHVALVLGSLIFGTFECYHERRRDDSDSDICKQRVDFVLVLVLGLSSQFIFSALTRLTRVLHTRGFPGRMR